MPRPELLTCTVALLMLGYVDGLGQDIIRVDPAKLPVTCFAGKPGIASHIPPPEVFREKGGSGSRTKSASIAVEYFGFPDRAQEAFEYAVSIWESMLVTPVEIRVAAVWTNLPAGALGSAGPGFWVANFDGAPRLNVYYPAALAEKLAGTDLNDPGEYDIVAQFNSSVNWHYNAVVKPQPDEYDLITVVLHELAHGLGFTSTFQVEGLVGRYGRYTDNGFPFPFDLFLENGTNVNLYESFDSPSAELGQQLMGNDLFFVSATGETVGKVFASAPFIEGSSISHLDAASYPQGTENSLMRPFVDPQEVNHDPGPVTQKILTEIGWVTTYIDHDHLADREDVNAPIVITASITADGTPGYNFDNNAITLSYSRSDLPGMTEVIMQPGGEDGEFAATLPAPMDAVTYSYSISVPDTYGRTFYSPGLHYSPSAAPGEKGPSIAYYTFSVGADNAPPDITHTPKTFISYLDNELVIDLTVSEGSGVSDALIELILPGDSPETTPLQLISSERDPLEGTTLYHYRKSVPLTAGTMQDGDIVQYRIMVTDNALAKNVSTYPEAGYVEVPVKGLAPVRAYYINDFDLPSDDFIGDAFTIASAIHSEHPYPEAGDGNELNLTYQLRVPIRVGSDETMLTFDEVVIVEPGEPGSVFGDPLFYDYVIVEGSCDGGQTWIPLVDGYDARAYPEWLSAYENQEEFDPSLFRKRSIDLLDTFVTGEEVVIRFRLFSDPFGNGWGWIIDNLHIQVDDVGPEILHDHYDYVAPGTSTISIPVSVSDDHMVDKIILEYFTTASQIPQTLEQDVSAQEAFVDFTLDISGLKPKEMLNYRYEAIDSAGNHTRFPERFGHLVVRVIQFDEVIDQYATDFLGAEFHDFVGNYFSHLEGAINSLHPYPAGVGTARKSEFVYTFTKKIRVSNRNPFMKFDEIVLVEPGDVGAAFGTPAFRDYVIVEASKDEGETWHALLDGYDASARSEWQQAYEMNVSSFSPQLFRQRGIDFTTSGDFLPGDEILIRFRMFSDESTTGWGWMIDNLHIQDEVTAVPDDGPIAKFLMHPNPIIDAKPLTIELQPQAPGTLLVSILNAVGHEVSRNSVPVSPQMQAYLLDVAGLANGVYIIRLNFGGETITRKFVVAR